MAKPKKQTPITSDERLNQLENLIKNQCVTHTVPIGEIEPNPFNVNKMGKEYFDALVAQISDPGIGFTTPIMVRTHPNPTGIARYQIIDGEHRWRAARQIGYRDLPVYDFGPISDAKLQFLMIAQNKIHGQTSDDDIKKVLAEVERLMADDPTMENIDVYARTVTAEPIEDAGKYGLDDDDLNLTKDSTVLVSLYFKLDQIDRYRQIVGQIRLASGVTAEDAVMQLVDHFAETTGFGGEGSTGDEILDEKQKDLIKKTAH